MGIAPENEDLLGLEGAGIIRLPRRRGQANYGAADAFLDTFAIFRQFAGLKANSIDSGAVEEVGHICRDTKLPRSSTLSTWTPINELLFLQIVEHL